MAIILGIVIAPVYVVSIALVFVYRLFVHIILLLTHPGYFGLLNILELFFDREKDGATSNINVLFQLKLTSFISVEELKSEMAAGFKRILRDKKKMNCIIKELWGVRFWEVTRVDVDKQIRGFQPKSEQDVKDYMADIATAPISGGLWEYFVAENPVNDHYPCIFRIHHALADGYALNNFFLDVEQEIQGRKASGFEISGKTFVQMEKTYKKLRQLYSEVRSAIIMFLCAPTICIDQYLRKRDKNSLLPIKPALKKQLGWHETDFNKVKEIHEKTGQSCTVVLLTALSKALDDIFISRGERVPYITAVFPFRRSQASNGLANEFIPVGLKLPVDSRQRETDVSHSCSRLQHQPNHKINYFIPRYTCLLFPRSLPNWAFRSTEFTVVFSNFPAPSKKLNFMGMECVHLLFFVPNFHDKNALGITVSSYGGKCTIASILDTAVVRTESDAQDIVDCMANYIDDTHSALFPHKSLNL